MKKLSESKPKRKCSQGFTLIELSIALVVIALVAGGILVGRSMIEVALLRKDMGMVEQAETAVNTFKLKYGDLPGDGLLPASKGFSGSSAGNGDGRIHGTTIIDYYEGYMANTEWFYVFHQLSVSGLFSIKDYDVTSSANNTPGLAYPKLHAAAEGQGDENALRMGGMIVSWEQGGEYVPSGHYARFGAQSASFGAAYLNFIAGYMPTDALRIDSKFDDGKPTSGRIRIGPVGWYQCVTDISPSGPGHCLHGGIGVGYFHCANTDLEYDVGYPMRACSLRIKMNF